MKNGRRRRSHVLPVTELPWEESEEMQAPDQGSGVLRDLAILLSPLLASAVAVLQVWRSLPGWVLFVAAAFYVVSVFAVMQILWPSIIGRIQAFRVHRRLETVAAREFLDLQQLVERFGILLNPSRSDSVHYVMRHVGQEIDRLGESRGRLSVPETSHLNFLFEDFVSRLQSAPRNFATFQSVGSEFEHIVAVYHYTFVLKPYERIQELGLSMIPLPYRSSLLSDLELQRENYSAFLRDLQSFSNRVNLAVDQEFFRTYYAPLRKFGVMRAEDPVNPREELDRRVRAYCRVHSLDPQNPDHYLQAKDEIFKVDPDLKQAYAKS